MSPLITPPVDSSNDHLANVKAFETWGDLYANQQSHHVPIGMDSYAELDFVSIDFVRSLNLTPCQKRQHNHHIPYVEAAGCSSLKTHGVYHLHGTLTDGWGHQFSFIRPVIAIYRDPKDTPILLERPALKEYRIVLDNESMEWEFKRKAVVKEYSSKRFQQLLRNLLLTFTKSNLTYAYLSY